MNPVTAILHALNMSFAMFWGITWALVLGFMISGAVQAVVAKGEMKRLLPNSSPRTLLVACGLGIASSSCSYAAVAIARSLIRKRANFVASIAFEFASTNLVIELGIILALLLGWKFTIAEFLGGFLMVYILAFLLRLALTGKLEREATDQADKGLSGKMEGHAEMDMSVEPSGGFFRRLFSRSGITATSHYFVMDVVSVWKDIVGGLLIAGALAAWVPNSFWQSFFLSNQSGIWPRVWGPIIGPLVSMASFVCSIGNVPLAAVLWNGGISFGGVVSFIFADLLILPVLNIYRKYYGWKMMLVLAGTSYVAMVLAGLIVEGIFYGLRITPIHHPVLIMESSISWNYTTFLNIGFAIVGVLAVVRFRRTGGLEMLEMMESPARERPQPKSG